jgi:hypothetical protein
MLSNGSSLVYMGEFNHQITKMFTSMAEEEMDRNNEQEKVKRKVYHAMVEVLQNMNMHSSEMSDRQIGSGLFIIGKTDDGYFITTSNKVFKDRIPGIQQMIDTINNSTKEELTAMYRKQIKEGRISNKGGAGLGLIDIARKTGTKYAYQFMDLDDEMSLFLLKIDVLDGSQTS